MPCAIRVLSSATTGAPAARAARISGAISRSGFMTTEYPPLPLAGEGRGEGRCRAWALPSPCPLPQAGEGFFRRCRGLCGCLDRVDLVRDRRAVHDTAVAHLVVGAAAMHGAAVIPHHQI